MSDETIDEIEQPRSFCRFLATLAGEQAEIDLSNEMHKLTTKLLLDAKSKGLDGESKGALTLTLEYLLDAHGQAVVSYKIDVKEPPKRTPKSSLYVTKGGNLQLENPRQQKMFFRDVSTKQETREVDDTGRIKEI